MNKLCQGCRYSELRDIGTRSYNCVILQLLESEEDCPCINCLVKMVCIENCDKRTKKRIEMQKR